MPTHGGTVRWIIEADDSQFNQTLDNVEKRAETTVKVLNRQDTSFWGSLSKGAKETSVSMGELASSLANVGWTAFNLGATSAVTALTSLVRKGVQATDFLETSRIAMAGLTGSVEAGNKAMSIAADYWSNNPFQRIDVTSATKQLVQFGRNTGQLAGDLKILGDVSLSSGVKIDELARYYARVSASGRAMTMDLEMMSDRGVPIYRELAKQLNTTTQGVRELASQGKIGFEEFRKAMESSVNPEAMEAYENTLARQMDRFKGSLQQLGASLAGYKVVNNEVIISEQGLEKAWMRLVKTLATALRSDKLKEALTTLGETLAKILDKVSAIIPKVVDWLAKVVKFLSENKALLAGVAGVATYFVGGLASKLPIVGGVIEKITGSAKGLVNVFTNLFKKNPLLAVFLGLLTTGLVTAYKNSEDFRNSISRLFSALGKLLQKIIPIFQAFVDIIVTIVSSDEFIWIMETLANVLASIAEALASIPTDVLTSLVTAFLMFSLLDSKPILGYAAAIMYIIAVVKKFGPAMIEGIKNTFENVGTAIYNAGKNFIIGFQNGINEGVKAVYNFLKQIAETMVATFQKALGIHSPSTVMAEQGKYVVLGLAEGITNNKSVAQKAMDMLASDILQSIEKIISNKIDFGLLDYPKQYQEWKKVSKMFAVGSQQYQTAIEKMEEARKQANLQILSLQRDYNDTLDSTISKIAKMYGLFDKVDTSGGKSSTDIISDLDQQVAALQNFASTKEALNNIGLETGLVDELQEMGIDAAQELATIAQMSGDEIARLNELWLAKQEQANRAGIEEVKNLKEKTLDQVDEIRKGIDGETIELQDVGGRLVENIAEGIYGAMPTLEDAFAQMGTYMAKAAKELGGSGSGSAGGITPDDITDPLKNTLNEAQNSLNKFAEDFGTNMMKSIGIGLVGGIALKWIAPKLISFFKDKVLHKGMQDTIANQLLKSGIGKTGGASELAKAAQESSKTATSVNQISSSTTSMSPGMSKVSQVEGLILKGALAVVAIAAAIAIMAGALRLTYELLKDVNLLDLLAQLGVMSAVLVVVGAIMGVIGYFGAFTGLGAIVTAVIGVALLACAWGLREASKIAPEIDYGAIFALEGGITIVSAILTAIAALAVFGSVGAVASAIIGGGLLLTAVSLAAASVFAKAIDFEAILALSGILAVVDTILAVISGFAVVGAITAVANDIIAGGLLVATMGLMATSLFARQIDFEAILELSGIMAAVDSILALLSTFAVLGAISAVANDIIAGGLLIAAIALVQVGEFAKQIDSGAIWGLTGILAGVDAILGTLSGFAVLGAVGAVANDIIVGGLLVAAIGLVQTSIYGGLIVQKGINNLLWAIGKVDSIMAIVSGISIVGSIGAIFTELITNGVMYAAKNLLEACNYAVQIKKKGIDKVQDILLEIAGWSTGDLFKNLQNLINSAMLSTISQHVRGVIDSLTGVKPLNTKVVDSIGENITKLSQMKIEGSGFFENKGGAARELEQIMRNVANIARMLYDMPWLDYDKSVLLIDTIKLFDRIDDRAKDGLNRMKDVGQALGNIDWVKYIFRDVPEDIWAQGERLIASVQLFDRIGDDQRNGALKMKEMGDSLGNIDWVKRIFGDVDENIKDKATRLVEAINELSKISINKEDLNKSSNEVKNLLDTIINMLNTSISALKDSGVNFAKNFIDGIKSQNEELKKTAADVQGTMWNVIESKMQDEFYQGAALAKKFKEGVDSVSLKSSGENAVQGFIDGANGKLNAVYKIGKDIADKFLRGLKDRGQQGSPWKTTFESGAWAGLGLAEGIASTEDLVVGEAKSLADQVIDALTMEDVPFSTDLSASVSGSSLPMMDMDGTNYGDKRPVQINQTNNNYTNYSMQKLNTDLAWEISKV